MIGEEQSSVHAHNIFNLISKILKTVKIFWNLKFLFAFWEQTAVQRMSKHFYFNINVETVKYYIN